MSAAWSPGCGTWSLASASANEVEAAATPPSASAPTADGLGVRAVRSSDRGAGPAVAMPLAPVSPARTADGWRTALVRPVETPCRPSIPAGGGPREPGAALAARRPDLTPRARPSRGAWARRGDDRRRSSRAPGYRPRCPRDRRPRATLPDARGRSAPAAPAAGYGSAAVAQPRRLAVDAGGHRTGGLDLQRLGAPLDHRPPEQARARRAAGDRTHHGGAEHAVLQPRPRPRADPASQAVAVV